MSATQNMTAATYNLVIGERYRCAIPGMPAWWGTFVGYLGAWGYIGLEDDEGQVTFYNVAQLTSIRPETYPPR